jgi:hypothetical protein
LLRASAEITPAGPFESLKAMADRIEGLGRGLVDLAEGRRPPSASGGTVGIAGITSTGGASFRPGPATSTGHKASASGKELRLEDVREEQEAEVEQLPDYSDDNDDATNEGNKYPAAHGSLEDQYDEEGSLDLSVLGFKTSLPPNPF